MRTSPAKSATQAQPCICIEQCCVPPLCKSIPAVTAGTRRARSYNSHSVFQHPNVTVKIASAWPRSARNYGAADPRLGRLSSKCRIRTHFPFIFCSFLFGPPSHQIANVYIFKLILGGYSNAHGVGRFGETRLLALQPPPIAR